MADGSVKFDTAIDSSGIRSGLAGLGKIALVGVGAAATAISGLGVASVKAGMDFDSAMSQVAATMGTTVDKIDNLREKAKEMGAKTAFSATEAAQALNYLALAGYDADKQMEALPVVLDLAAAGSMDLAYASDLVTDSMSALGLETSELATFSDKMAKTASKANTSVAQLGEATLICGGQAKLAGMSVTDMNTALGILADNGIKGSEGGTALRNVLKNLYTPTKKQADALKELGVKTANADGSLRDAQDVLKDLSGALDGLTEADKMTAMANIFDTRTIAGANALLNNATDRWDELSAAIDDSADACAKMAATQLDNLEGDITILGSAFEGLKISISDGLTGSLREFVQFGTEQLDILNAAMAEGGFSGLVEAAGTVLGNVLNKIISYTPTLIGAAIGLIENFITTILDNSGMIIDAVGQIGTMLLESVTTIAPVLFTAAGDIVLQLANGIVSALPTIISSAHSIVDSLCTTIVSVVPQLIPIAANIIAQLAIGLVQALPTIIKAVLDLATGIVEALIESVPILLEALFLIVEELLAYLPELIPTILEAVLSIVTAIIEYLPELITMLVEQLPLIVEQIVTALLESLPLFIEGVMALVNGVIAAIPQIITTICAALPTLITGVIGGLLAALPQIVQCGIQLFVSLIAALPDIITGICDQIPTLIDSILQSIIDLIPLIIECGIDLFVALVAELPLIITTIVAAAGDIIDEIIWAVIDSIPMIIEAGIDLLCALVEALPEIIVAVVAAIPVIVTSLVDAIIGSIGLIVEAGVNLLCALVLNLPHIILELLKAIPKIISALVDGLIGGVSRFVEAGGDLIAGLWEGISGKADWIGKKIKSFCSNALDAIKGFFGIKSPSRVFKNVVGKNLMLGLAEGIDDEASTAVSALGNAAKEIGDVEFEASGIQFEDPEAMYAKVSATVEGQVSGMTAAKAAVANGYDNSDDGDDSDETSRNKPEYIENNIIIDGRKAARILTPYVAQELAWEGK